MPNLGDRFRGVPSVRRAVTVALVVLAGCGDDTAAPDTTLAPTVITVAPTEPASSSGVDTAAVAVETTVPAQVETTASTLAVALPAGEPAERADVGGFTAAVWAVAPEESVGAVTDPSGGVLAYVQEVRLTLDEATGQDLTDDGSPEVVFRGYSGGAHCCTSYSVVQTAEPAGEIFRSPATNCGGSFGDLDGDGVAEFATCDDIWAYSLCAFAGSPAPAVVLAWDGSTWSPAIGAFQPNAPFQAGLEAYARDVAAGATEENREEVRCAVAAPVLGPVYDGNPDAGWALLNELWPYDDPDAFRAELESILATSVYAAALGY